MYGQLLYFIAALLIFSIQQPQPMESLSVQWMLVASGGTFLLFVFACRAAFTRLHRVPEDQVSFSVLSRRFHRTHDGLCLLALAFLAVQVYVYHIKSFLGLLPLTDRLVTLMDLLGLGLFFLHLLAVWFFGYPVYQKIHRSELSRTAYVRGNLSFSMAILVPWLIISLASDAVQVFGSKTFLHSEGGQILLSYLLLISFVFLAPPIVVTLWGCTSIEPGPIRDELEAFCARHRFRVADFKLWPLFGGETLTAGVFGILPRLRYILITRGLLSILNKDELHSVMAHEMGHVRLYHMVFYLFLFGAFMAVTFSFDDSVFIILLAQTGAIQWLFSPDSLSASVVSLLFNFPFVLLLLFYFRYVFGFFMRNSERQADIFALRVVGHPNGLVSSLQKIALISGRAEDTPSWHHFSIRERIDFLKRCHREPALMARHDRKLHLAAVAFLTVMTALCLLGVHLGKTDFYKLQEMEARAAIAELELKRTPHNPLLLAEYGGILFQLGRIGEARAILESAMEQAPDNPHILNNLAWLYATSPPPDFQPERSLELAVRAVELDPLPHILDTLAEAYFVNSRYEEALKAIEEALKKETKDRGEFLSRKRKIEEALHGKESEGHKQEGEKTGKRPSRGLLPADSA